MNRRLTALIIGISKYPDGAALKNPSNDAEDISKAMTDLGFTVIQKIDCTAEEIDRAVTSFRDNLNSNDIGLFYFAGHGMQVKGENYLNAIDTNFDNEISAKHSSYPLSQIIEVMDACSNKTNLIILDACRNNPFIRAWNRTSDQRGLASVYTPKGTLIGFATSPGEVAADGKNRNGSYTEALLKHINTLDIPIEDLFKRVRNTLSVITNGRQTSWEHTSLAGDFHFHISAGRSLSIYDNDAIADSQFPLLPTNDIKSAIRALKSSNWYTQNPAISAITLTQIEASDINTLFVLGRNIYQAACGGANSAISYISNFRTKVGGTSQEKSKAILDGMLFEVFFNSKGDIRKDFKTSRFNELFELQKIPDFSPSFEQISDVLMTYQNRFYIIPGKSRAISIDITTEKLESGESLILGIFFEGVDILKKALSIGNYDLGTFPIRTENLNEMISTEMMIPSYQIKINSDIDMSTEKILYPLGAKLAK
ncbi:MAG: caspase family protein [Christensenellaceae bacterium]